MSNLRDYYIKEQTKKDKQDAIAEFESENKQIRLANDLRDLIGDTINEILRLAETVRPEAFPVSWKMKRKQSLVQSLFGINNAANSDTFAWDIGLNYFLTIDGILLIRRHKSRDYRDGSVYFIESFPKRGSLDDPYSACECLINFMEKLNANSDDICRKRNTLKTIKENNLL